MLTQEVALVFVPPGPFDLACALAAVAYCRRRGYHPGAVIHGDWRTVERILCERLAEVVVFAGESRRWATEIGSADYLDRETSRRLWTGERRESSRWTTGDVRRALYGGVPVHGVDRSTIEALRHLADHFRDCGGGGGI